VANQALLEALALAREIPKGCIPLSNWREVEIRESVLTMFECRILERIASKVKDLAAVAEFLYSEIVLQKNDEPRGRSFRKKNAL
tara:strand:+ start:1246 stop:1500 length:255 start_codon:yes stop_codon:yes gene_type:complete